MIELTSQQLEIIQNILREEIPQHTVSVFGSRTKKSTKQFADLDLLVRGRDRLSLEKLASLKNRFSESNLPFRVDIVDEQDTSEEFLKTIKSNCEIIQMG